MLKAILNSLDGLDEALKKLYKEIDGKFVLQVEPVDGYTLEDTTTLKNTLAKERADRQTAEGRVAAFKDIDPKVAKDAIAKWNEFKDIDPAKEADRIANEKVEAKLKQIQEKHAEELSARDTRIAKLTGITDKKTRHQQALEAIAAEKGNVDLLLPHVLNNLRGKEDNDDFIVEVIGSDGNARIGDSKGGLMTVRQLVQEMKTNKAFAPAFEASGQSGSGMQPGGGGNGVGGKQEKGNMGGSKQERVEALKAKFPDLNKVEAQ